MNGSQSAAAAEFELTVEVCADARPVPGFHVTRTRTFFVDNHGRVFLVAAPGHRAMLLRVDELPADAEPTRDVPEPEPWVMARAVHALGRGQPNLPELHIADFYAWRTRLFHVHAGQVFELHRELDGVRFAPAPLLPTGAVPFTEAEAEQLGDDIHEAARRLTAS
jgi:hypothetical protein